VDLSAELGGGVVSDLDSWCVLLGDLALERDALKDTCAILGGMTYALVCEGLSAGSLAVELALASEGVEVLLWCRHGVLAFCCAAEAVIVVPQNGDGSSSVESWDMAYGVWGITQCRDGFYDQNEDNKTAYVVCSKLLQIRTSPRNGQAIATSAARRCLGWMSPDDVTLTYPLALIAAPCWQMVGNTSPDLRDIAAQSPHWQAGRRVSPVMTIYDARRPAGLAWLPMVCIDRHSVAYD
jgi:hypothetical protein